MKTVLLIGLGRFGRHIAYKLNELDHEVMAVDKKEERVAAVLNKVTRTLAIIFFIATLAVNIIPIFVK